MDSSITRLTLSNGLLVLLKEIHTAPIISQWIWYRVGSRDERPGMTGASHWVEHMQFKGTPQFPGSDLDRVIAREGGFWNAYTNLDWTAYFETMPAHKIDLALRLEADRMSNSLFDPIEVEAERTVIISERQGSENDPLFRLSEAMQSAAFALHPYRNQVIGSVEDLRIIQRDDLYQHYRRYYVPNNAVLAMAGDFDTAEMLARLCQLYEPVKAGETPLRNTCVEPDAMSEKRIEMQGPGDAVYICANYHAPAVTHPDFFPLLVADSLLSGPGNLSMLGGGLSNKTSRLYRALVDRELAVSVSGGLQATLDPFLYDLTLVVHPDCTPQDVIRGLDAEMGRLQDTPPPLEELARAMKQARALFVYGSERITNQASWMGMAEMVADYAWFLEYLPRLEAVTPKDVQRVAQAYLRPENRVLGVYMPTGAENEKEEE